MFWGSLLTPKSYWQHGSLNFLFFFHFNFNDNNGGEVILNQYETLEISLKGPHIHLTDLKNKMLLKTRFFLKPVLHTNW